MKINKLFGIWRLLLCCGLMSYVIFNKTTFFFMCVGSGAGMLFLDGFSQIVANKVFFQTEEVRKR